MRKIILFCVVILFTTISIQAQENTVLKVKNNELSFGFYNIFQLNNANTVGLLYKRTIKNGALRLGSSFNISNTNTESESSDQYSRESTYYSISPRIGYEFRNEINKWQIFYGADLKYTYSYNFNKSDNGVAYYQQVSELSIKSNGFGIRPFVGIKYQINNWISVTTETGLLAQYNESKTNEKYFNQDMISPSEANSSTSGFSLWMEPLGMLSLNFNF